MAMLNNQMVRITHCICSRWAFHTRLKVESRKEVLSQLRDRVGQAAPVPSNEIRFDRAWTEPMAFTKKVWMDVDGYGWLMQNQDIVFLRNTHFVWWLGIRNNMAMILSMIIPNSNIRFLLYFKTLLPYNISISYSILVSYCHNYIIAIWFP